MLNQGHNNLDNPITQKAEKNFFFALNKWVMVMRKVLKWQSRDTHWDKPTHKEGTHNIMTMIFQLVHDIQVFDILHEEFPRVALST